MKKNLVIIGAGGHGKVVAESAMLSFNIVGFADDTTPLGTEIIKGIKVIALTKEIEIIKTLMTLSKVKKEKVLPFDYENAEY